MQRGEGQPADLRLFVGSVLIDVVVSAVLLVLNHLGVVSEGVVTFVVIVVVASTTGPMIAFGVDKLRQLRGSPR